MFLTTHSTPVLFTWSRTHLYQFAARISPLPLPGMTKTLRELAAEHILMASAKKLIPLKPHSQQISKRGHASPFRFIRRSCFYFSAEAGTTRDKFEFVCKENIRRKLCLNYFFGCRGKKYHEERKTIGRWWLLSCASVAHFTDLSQQLFTGCWRH